jgi:hypothetical protein
MSYRTEVVDDAPGTVDSERTVTRSSVWNPLQLVGLIVGIGFVVLGVVTVIKTGFDTSHIYTPQDTVWSFHQSPLFALIEIGFGVLLVLASVVPGGSPAFTAFLGAISLAFGLVVLFESAPNRLNTWLGVDHRSGWLFTIVGAVLIVAAALMPLFGVRSTRHRVRELESVQ